MEDVPIGETAVLRGKGKSSRLHYIITEEIY
jgi:hypothetical protein